MKKRWYNFLRRIAYHIGNFADDMYAATMEEEYPLKPYLCKHCDKWSFQDVEEDEQT